MTTLKNVLLVNAVSSGATGVGLIIIPDVIANLFEVSKISPFVGVGVFLMAFAAAVYLVSRRTPSNENAVRLIIFLDSIWVAGSIGIIMFQLPVLSKVGYLIVGAVAAWVGLMAYLQYQGVKQTRFQSKDSS